MIQACYKLLWSRIGGRPWTYIMRDFAYRNPLLMLVGGFTLGVWLQPWAKVDHLVMYSTGVLTGHLFWGTKWRPGQQANGNDAHKGTSWPLLP